MKAEDIMGYLTIGFGIFGSWGLCKQGWMIGKSRSTASVSGIAIITPLMMFAAFLIYGMQQHSFPMQFQGWVRVAFLSMVLGLYIKFGELNKTEKILLIVYPLLLALMMWQSISWILFIGFSYLGIWASFAQAFKIWRLRSRGQVSVELQLIYLASIICWLIYGFIRMDIPLISTSIGFTLSYAATIFMWFRFRAVTV